MIIMTTQAEYAALSYAMGIMSDSVKKMIKKRYKEQKKEMLESYRSIFGRANAVLDNGDLQRELYLDKFDVQLLHDFLDAYLDKMQAMDLRKQRVAPEHRKNKEFVLAHLIILEAYKKRMVEIKAVYEVKI